MSLLFFEPIPLISTESLGDFAEPSFVGHHYGDLRRTRVRAIKINPQIWLVGAHPWQAVTHCWVGDKRTLGFQPFTQEDSDGITRQYVRLTLPPSSDAFTVEVAGLGKMSSRTGRLLENPADIIRDIAELCGRELSMPFFKEACDARTLRIAGSVIEDKSLRHYVNEIVESCGAVWAGDTAFFRDDPIVYANYIRSPISVEHSRTLDDVAGFQSVYYNWNESRQWNGSHVQLAAVGCQYDNLSVYYAKWLRQPRDAERLARELLQRKAGEFVKIKATVPARYKGADAVTVDSANFTGSFRIETALHSPSTTEITGQILIEAYDNIRLKHATQEIPLNRTERVDVVILENGEVEIAVFDQQNRPLAGIFVTIDNQQTQETNQLGVVSFTLGKGDHTLSLSGQDIDNSDPFPLYIP